MGNKNETAQTEHDIKTKRHLVMVHAFHLANRPLLLADEKEWEVKNDVLINDTGQHHGKVNVVARRPPYTRKDSKTSDQ